VILGSISANPDAKWMQQQARNATMLMEERGHLVSHLIRDHDGKFAKEFDAIFEAEGAEIVKVGPRAPNMKGWVSFYTSFGRFDGNDMGSLRQLVTLLFLWAIGTQGLE
jgi:hypothetical protein